jgi:hypothetical protein
MLSFNNSRRVKSVLTTELSDSTKACRRHCVGRDRFTRLDSISGYTAEKSLLYRPRASGFEYIYEAA